MSVIALLVVLGLIASSCAPDPPHIALADVVDFWVAPGRSPDPEIYHPSGSLNSIVAAYNGASGHSFSHDTTPSLRAQFRLKDGTTIYLAFAALFPRGCLLIQVVPPRVASGKPATGTQGERWYEAKAPGLVVMIWLLAGQHLDPGLLKPDPTWVNGES